MKSPNCEITWSLMHPTVLDADYMKRVIAEAEQYHVDSFEICASCHSLLGGLGGLVLYEDYPTVAAALDREGILETRRTLAGIVDLAHQSGRPVFYWHREATVWPELLKVMPDLMDDNGEFNLLGPAYEKLLRYKITRGFAAVPQLDGLVLTLTEADFSTIHNSTPEKYPPEQVVSHIVRIFAEELQKLNKRFILRSFGSVAQDYEDILKGAAEAAADFHFEVETKITPYDFDPFLPDNPFMKPIKGLTMGAECDSLGEFLGAGFLPAENVENIVRYVRWGQKCGVDRFTIRLDRMGNNIFDCYPINLYAYEQAILHPELSAEQIRQQYAELHYPASCRQQLLDLGHRGFTAVVKTQYIDHHLIFHQFPPKIDLKWLKAGGILSVFQPEQSLERHTGIWSILHDRPTPPRSLIRREKQEAAALARQSLQEITEMQPLLSPSEYQRLRRLWHNAVLAAEALSSLTEVILAYCEDMEAGHENAPALRQQIDCMEKKLMPLMNHPETVTVQTGDFINGMDHQLFTAYSDLDQVYLKPLIGMAKLLLEEFAGDFQARAELKQLPGIIDYIVPGSATDEIRCIRFMHASHVLFKNGRPGRLVGNQVFPNGFVEFHLNGKPDTRLLLQLWGEGTCRIEVDGETYVRNLSDHPILPVSGARDIPVILRKSGSDYPIIQKIALSSSPAC